MGMRSHPSTSPCVVGLLDSLLSPVSSPYIKCLESLCFLAPSCSKPPLFHWWWTAGAFSQGSSIPLLLRLQSLLHTAELSFKTNHQPMRSSTHPLKTPDCARQGMFHLLSASLPCSSTPPSAFTTQFQSHWPPFHSSNT